MKTIDGKADNASESIKAYKNKWIIDGENANPTLQTFDRAQTTRRRKKEVN